MLLTAWRREVLDWFRFDETLPGYSYLEDVDLSYRTSRLFGHMFVPSARCLHLSSAQGQRRKKQLARILARNHIHLFRRNLTRDPATVVAFGLSLWGLCLRALLWRNPDEAGGIVAGINDGLKGKGK